MRATQPIFFALLGLALTACSGGDHGTAVSTTGAATAPATATATTAVAPASGAPSAPASGAPSASASGAPHAGKKKPPKSFDALKEELEKKCPAEPKDNNLEQKQEYARVTECLRRKMNADLDAVLLPLKKADEAKFKSLMKEQAEWNRLVEAVCHLEEERFWIDFETGARSDGTMRGYPYIGCLNSAYSERILYAKALEASKPELLSKRVEELQADGARVKTITASVLSKATAFQAAPPKVQEGMVEVDWKKVKEGAAKTVAAAMPLAKSTCAFWPELAKALGGKAKCEAKAELYYYMQGAVPDPTAP
jgi:hypothetical protein